MAHHTILVMTLLPPQWHDLRVQSNVVSVSVVYVVDFPAMLVVAVSVSCGTAVIILVTAVIVVICVTR